MSYVKFEHRSLSDDAWLDATPEAFVVHVWALDHCNEQATDGHITEARAHRLVCPVPPTDLPDAWKVLTHVGLWERTDDGYFCPAFLAHGIAAEEQHATREKWAHDKRRQRLHRIGNHELCSPRSCPQACPPVDSTEDSTLDKWTTRPDPTRPDQTPKGSGKGRGSEAVARSADATRARPEVACVHDLHISQCQPCQALVPREALMPSRGAEVSTLVAQARENGWVDTVDKTLDQWVNRTTTHKDEVAMYAAQAAYIAAGYRMTADGEAVTRDAFDYLLAHALRAVRGRNLS